LDALVVSAVRLRLSQLHQQTKHVAVSQLNLTVNWF